MLAILAQGALREGREGQAAVEGGAPGRLLQAQQGATGGRLATARLTDQGEDLTASQGEAHPVEGVHVAPLGTGQAGKEALRQGEVDLEVLDAVELPAGQGGRGRQLGQADALLAHLELTYPEAGHVVAL